MGNCSSESAVQTSDSITKGQVAPLSNAEALSKTAQEQLRLLQAQHPAGTLGGTPSKKSSKLAKLLNEQRDAGDNVDDLDAANEDLARGKHGELWRAVELNHSQQVAIYLDKYAEASGQELQQAELYDACGNTVIHKAASLGHAESLMMLLERTEAKPDILNASLATPLHLACKNNRVDAAKFLIGCGVDVNAQDEHGQAPLLICCIHGHHALAQIIVDAHLSGHLQEPLEVDMRDHRGLSCLNCTSIKGDLKMTMMLVTGGGAKVDSQSPKGCTPLLYAARGGYSDVVRFLLLKGASALLQDNAGGTVLHHAIEKGHTNVLQVLLEHGVNVYSAIEIPDNAGRTAVFEAIEHHKDTEILDMLTRPKEREGFGAKVNITNYTGQTPLFSAVREGNLEMAKHLVDTCDARVDLTQGELYPEQSDEAYDSLEEKFFMEAYKNSMTPLQVAVVLGYEELIHFLISRGANPNLQTKTKGYSCLHLAVLANKPEVIIELLTKTPANPNLPDFGGRTLRDMVEIFIPSYLESFGKLLQNLAAVNSEQEETLMGLMRDGQPKVQTHYVNPDDERSIQGLGQTDQAQINELYAKDLSSKEAEQKTEETAVDFAAMDESEIKVESDQTDTTVAEVFGTKVALAMNAANWKVKEQALKLVQKTLDKGLEGEEPIDTQLLRAALCCVGQTCREKVIKVFTVSMAILIAVVNSQKVEKQGAMELVKNVFVEKNLVLKLLQKSEEGNTRTTNKIHECLLDLSFNADVGEALASSFILQRIQAHNRAIAAKTKKSDAPAKIETEQALGSYKGLLAQLALLFKFINNFGIASMSRGPLSVKDVLKSVTPSLSHANADVRNAATKIVLDVQKLSGCVTEEELAALPEKTRQALMPKLGGIEVEKNLRESQNRPSLAKVPAQIEEVEGEVDGEQTDRAEVPETISAGSPVKGQAETDFADLRELIEEKSAKKDWQERDLALQALQEAFSGKAKTKQYGERDLLNSEFLEACLYLLRTCLEENNISLYLLALECASNGFIQRTIETEQVYGSLKSLLAPVVLRTTDTNTRVRKRSVELVNLVWDYVPVTVARKVKLTGPRDSFDGGSTAEKRSDTITSLMAQVICDPTHGEKAIIGRLGLLVKRGQKIEGSQDLMNKPLVLIMGRTYEQLTEFACQWMGHANPKIRQNAMRLVVEVSRINAVDPRGHPFKQRIINYVLGLRSGQRDPLIKKINEVCKKATQNSVDFVDVSELDIAVAGKSRAASMDHVKRRPSSAFRGAKASALPQIAAGGGGHSSNQPTIVLPHSEPLSEEQKTQHAQLIDMFGLPLMTCMLSQKWSTRLAAIEKVEEQLHNLDPNRRDAMGAEINRSNLPPQVAFKTFVDLVVEGIKDPVLKNFVAVLDLLQKALAIFFRFVKTEEVQTTLAPIITEALRKTAAMAAKIRETSQNFCLHLSHQSPIGPEFMTKAVLAELTNAVKAADAKSAKQSAAASYGNSHLVVACLGLLADYQTQSGVLAAPQAKEMKDQVVAQINLNLRHSNPQVRKSAERLFIVLYREFGQALEGQLKDQKPALVSKLVQAAKMELIQTKSNLATSAVPNKQAQEVQAKQIETAGIQRANDRIRDSVLNLDQLKAVLGGAEQHLQDLKAPNHAKRQKAIVELKKALSRKFADSMTQDRARELFDPLTMLLRHLLQDSASESYLESLSFLKFVVASLAPHLTVLDLHLMMGQFIGIIVHNTVAANIRVQVATDKVVIYFAKHGNIGSLVVARELLKSLDRHRASPTDPAALEARRGDLVRFLGILQLLLQQFQLVLCYQADFFQRCLECLADQLNAISDPQDALRIQISQIIYGLHAADSKMLDQTVGTLELARKTPLRKIIIEHESAQRQGKGFIDAGATGDQMRDTQTSFAPSEAASSLFSPGQSQSEFGMGRGRSPGGFGASQYSRGSKRADKGVADDQRGFSPGGAAARPRRMMSVQRGTGSTFSTIEPASATQESWKRRMEPEGGVLNRTGVLLPRIDGLGSGIAGGPMGSTALTFEPGGSLLQTEQKPRQDAGNQMKMKSTGGAGFSSQQKSPFYDPADRGSNERRRTPRRNLQTIIGAGNAPQQAPEISRLTGLGTSIPQASDATTANSRGTMGGDDRSPTMTGLGAGQQPHRPPLYVPTKRQPSQQSRGSQDRSVPGAYKPKTGFSTAGMMGSTKSSLGGSASENKPPLASAMPSKPIMWPSQAGKRQPSGSRLVDSQLPEPAECKFMKGDFN